MYKVLFLILLTLLCACAEELTSDQHLQRAREFALQAEFESAMIELKNALKLEPEMAKARCLLGKVYLDTGEYTDAEKELLRAHSLGCSDDEVLPALANALLLQGKFADVLALDTAQMSPENRATAVSLQAIAALSNGDRVLAQDHVDAALEMAPQSVKARLAQARLYSLEGDSDASLALLDEVLQEAPGDDEAWRLKAHTLWRLNDLSGARGAFGQAIEFSRLPIADRVSRAIVNMLMEDYPRAKEDAVALEELAPYHPGSNYVKGLLLFRAGHYRDAITTLAQGEAAEQRYPLMLFCLAIAHIIDGSPDVAETYAERFLQIAPNSIEGRKLHAILLLQKADAEGVEEVLQPVLDFNSNDVNALYILANAQMLNDEADQGLFTFDWIRKLEPELSLQELPLTRGLFTSELARSAEHELQQALAPLPDFPRKEVLQILESLKQEDFAAAVEAAEAYKWRDLSGIAPYNVLGNVYVAADEIEKAREVFLQALNRDAANPAANLQMAQLERKAEKYREGKGALRSHIRG